MDTAQLSLVVIEIPHWRELAFVVAVSAAWSLWRWFRWSQQSAEVDMVAPSFGLQPLPELPINRQELKTFDFPFGLGKLHNILGGSSCGHEVVLFDTEVGHPRGEPTLQTMAAFKLPSSKLPDFTLEPKNVVGKVFTAFGTGIDFDDDPSFSDAYFLMSADKSRTRACFTPEFRNFFVGLERFDSRKNWHIQKRGSWVIIYRKNEGVSPDELQTFLEGTTEVVCNLEGEASSTR